MISEIFRKREDKVKGSILRGIYEENLKMIGKNPGNISGGMPLPLRKMVLSLSLVLLAVFGYGNYSNISLFQEKKDATAYHIPKQTGPGHIEKTMFQDQSTNPSEFKAFLAIPEISLSHTFGFKVHTVMIDPGHGGSDSGTIGKMGTKEKDVTLDIAKRLKERLEKHTNYKVLMTREEDLTVPLNDRIEMARSHKADLFISVHFNYLPSKPINIVETYYFGPSSNAYILKLAEIENSGSQYGLSDFKEIIERIGDTLKYQESKELAASIQKNLFANIRKLDGNVQDFGIKRGPFLVLLGVDVPSVLTEVACLSNRKEEEALNTESYRNSIAYYLEAGILEYLNKGEVSHEAKRK